MIGMTNAGGSGTGCTLTITAPAGAAITVANKAGKVKSKTVGANGLVVFRGLTEGTWTITITNGTDTATKTVEIKADYETQIGFFTATIHVVYPAGLVCTATNGSTTMNAPDTSGTWDCVVTEAGEWTVTLSTGFAEKVTVGASGESHTVNKWYVYKDGDQRTELTGGWISAKSGNPTITFDVTKIHIDTKTATNQPKGKAFTKNTCNITGFSVLKAAVTMVKQYNSTVGTIEVGVSADAITNAGTSGAAKGTTKATGTMSVDLSGVKNELAAMYPYFKVNSAVAELQQMWLEV